MADAAPLRDGDEVTSGALYRRIPPLKDYFKPPPENRATSLNFLPDRAEEYVSMFRAAETSASDVLTDHDGFGLLEIDAEKLWALGLRVIYRPLVARGTSASMVSPNAPSPDAMPPTHRAPS